MKFKPNPLLYGANEDFFSAFRLAIRMKDTVDYDLLSRSVEQVMVRYPYFCVYPCREGESLVLHYNKRPLPVLSLHPNEIRCPLLSSLPNVTVRSSEKTGNGRLL